VTIAMYLRTLAGSALLFGGLFQLLLNGHPFQNALVGIACCLFTLLAEFMASLSTRFARCSKMLILLGLVLGLACVAILPNAYRAEQKLQKFRQQLQAKQS
jgi:hypothetical protein